uniref:Zgc:101663 n=1 Tax=Tetraodon nigroviridis TaxID=99883 RepID=H3CM04_TETNG
QQSWLDAKNFLPLNVTYQLLAGTPPSQKRYLAVGISSVKRIKGMYLLSTLESIMSQSSPEERASMVVVLLLADFDASWRNATVTQIQSRFPSELDQGHLLVLHVAQDFYPPLQGLKRNYNDPPDRTFRSKQNVDYSFLINYSAGLSHYYLQLEDDVSCANNFFTHIRRRTEEEEAKKSPWAVIEFSVLGYIGKLYKSGDAPLLARFLFLFYQEMPCDWLMSHFRQLLTQKETIVFKPSLFQHMGTFSSFSGNQNSLKDKYFQEDVSPNPPAEVFTDMSVYQENVPRRAWNNAGEYFWSHSIKKGNTLTAVLAAPAVFTSIVIETGAEGRDQLESGQVELGRGVIAEGKSCAEFQSVGTFRKGRFESNQVDREFGSASSCLRIRVTADQHSWLIVRNIRVRT